MSATRPGRIASAAVTGPVAVTPAQERLGEQVQALARRLRLGYLRAQLAEPTSTARSQRRAPPRSCASCSTQRPPAVTGPGSPCDVDRPAGFRQDVRGLGPRGVLGPGEGPAGAAHP